MKKIIPILSLLLLLVGCGNNNPEKTAKAYLDSLQELDHEETKTYYANANEFFILKDFTDRLSDGFRIIQSDNLDEKTLDEIMDSVRNYNDKAYEKAMDFQYEILDSKKSGKNASVKVKLTYEDGKDYKKIAESIERPDYNDEDFSKKFVNYYDELGKSLDKYDEKKETIIVLNLEKQKDGYKIVNSSEVYNILIEPLTKFIEINQKWMEV